MSKTKLNKRTERGSFDTPLRHTGCRVYGNGVKRPAAHAWPPAIERLEDRRLLSASHVASQGPVYPTYTGSASFSKSHGEKAYESQLVLTLEPGASTTAVTGSLSASGIGTVAVDGHIRGRVFAASFSGDTSGTISGQLQSSAKRLVGTLVDKSIGRKAKINLEETSPTPTTPTPSVIPAPIAQSSQAGIPALATVPLGAPWSNTDIGSVGIAGTAAVAANGSISVTGSGAAIGGSTDSFHFAWQTLAGNGTLIARIGSQSSTNGSAQSGIMIRESLAVDARYVDLVLTGGSGIAFQDRLVSHNPPASASVQGSEGEWLKLVRSGSTITGYVSKDGVNWVFAGSANITLVNNVDFGLCVTSASNAASNTASFSNVAITGTGAQASAWSRAATDPVTRWESQSFTWNGQLYIFGGFTDRTLDVTTDCDAYNPATNTWRLVTHMPAGITHAATVVVGNTAYFVGGNIGQFTYKHSLTTAQVLTYNLVTNTWGSAPSLPIPTAAGGVVNIGSYLYFYGGIGAGIEQDYGNTWALNLNDLSAGWIKRAAMPNPRNHIGYVAINGIAYAVGGNYLYDENAGNTAEIDAYNPATNTWKQVASLPMPWSSLHCDTMTVNGKILIVGGQTNGGYDGIYLTNIDEFNPATNSWSRVGSLPEPNEGQSDAVIDNELIVVNGTVDNYGGWAQDETLIDSQIGL